MAVHAPTAAQDTYVEWKKMVATMWVWIAISILLVPVSFKHSKHTWFARRFNVHRIGGLAFLLQYGIGWTIFLNDYDAFAAMKWPALGIALNGVLQAASAVLTFTFLPQMEDSGYFSDKSIISRLFITENLFYQIMCLFGCIYYSEWGYNLLRYGNISGQIDTAGVNSTTAVAAWNVVEVCFVFLPYVIFRPLFPTTRFKTAIANEKNKTEANVRFYRIGTQLIKVFYVWGKHFMGFHLNYLRFLGLLSEQDMKWVRGLWLLNSGTVSVAVFLHTMRFKKLIAPRVTFSCYAAMSYASFLSLWWLFPTMFLSRPKIVRFTTLGLVLNLWRGKQWVLKVYFCTAAVLFSIARLAPEIATAATDATATIASGSMLNHSSSGDEAAALSTSTDSSCPVLQGTEDYAFSPWAQKLSGPAAAVFI